MCDAVKSVEAVRWQISTSLIQHGIENPRNHIIILKVIKGPADGPSGVGTILVSKKPFSNSDLNTIERITGQLQFEIVYSPRSSMEPDFAKIVSGKDRDEFIEKFPVDISAPTDNKPFFFNMLRLFDIFNPEIKKQAGLGINADELVANLPFGVQKRIELIRALLAEPTLLMLDEPAAGLNLRERQELQVLLENISGRGITLLVVEHDMKFIGDLCDQVVVLNFGRKIAEGTPAEISTHPEVRKAYLGNEEIEEAEDAA